MESSKLKFSVTYIVTTCSVMLFRRSLVAFSGGLPPLRLIILPPGPECRLKQLPERARREIHPSKISKKRHRRCSALLRFAPRHPLRADVWSITLGSTHLIVTQRPRALESHCLGNPDIVASIISVRFLYPPDAHAAPWVRKSQNVSAPQ